MATTSCSGSVMYAVLCNRWFPVICSGEMLSRSGCSFGESEMNSTVFPDYWWVRSKTARIEAKTSSRATLNFVASASIRTSIFVVSCLPRRPSTTPINSSSPRHRRECNVVLWTISINLDIITYHSILSLKHLELWEHSVHAIRSPQLFRGTNIAVQSLAQPHVHKPRRNSHLHLTDSARQFLFGVFCIFAPITPIPSICS